MGYPKSFQLTYLDVWINCTIKIGIIFCLLQDYLSSFCYHEQYPKPTIGFLNCTVPVQYKDINMYSLILVLFQPVTLGQIGPISWLTKLYRKKRFVQSTCVSATNSLWPSNPVQWCLWLYIPVYCCLWRSSPVQCCLWQSIEVQ